MARGDAVQICILLQLILGAAVNCECKNDFIADLMQLDEIDQELFQDVFRCSLLGHKCLNADIFYLIF